MSDEYVKTFKLSELPNKKGKQFQLDDDHEIAVFKIYDKVYAVDNICPHNHVPQMFDGYIDEMYVTCPIHGFKFHLETGEQPTKIGCKLKTYELKIEDDYVYIKKPKRKLFDFHF